MYTIRYICMTLMCLMGVAGSAQTADVYFRNMPDSIFPYLTHEEKNELVALKRVAPADTASMASTTWGEVRMVGMTDALVTLSVADRLDVQVMAMASGTDSVYCVVSTVKGDCDMSMARVYDRNYALVDVVSVDDSQFVARPDTMSMERYDELASLIEFVVPRVQCADDATLVLTPQVPLITNEEKERLRPLLLQTKLKWGGERFKKCKI